MALIKSTTIIALAVTTAACAGNARTPAAASPAPIAAADTSMTTTAAISAHDLRVRLTAFAHDSMMGREAGTYWNEQATEYVQQQFFHLNLRPGGEHGSYFQTVPNIRVRDTSMIRGVARNVIAVVRGSDPVLRDEYIAISAHNDHIGYTHRPVDHDSLRAFNTVIRPMGADSRSHTPSAAEERQIRTILDSLRRLRPARADSVNNGADDDGSGTVALLEIAEAFAKNPVKPKRSILLVSHTAEEKGLIGSEWFTDHSTVPMDSIVAEIDVDMIGRGAPADIKGGGPTYLEVVGLRRLSTEYGDWFESVNAREPSPFVFNYEFDAPGHPEQYYCRADHYSYARYGVPSVSLSRGGHMDYHQLTDESQYIDYQDLARVTQMVFDAAQFIANADHRPPTRRTKANESARPLQAIDGTAQRVALATYSHAPNLAPDDQLLLAALQSRGLTAVPSVWSDRTVDWDDFDAIIVRSCWDYHLRPGEFGAWLDRIGSRGVPMWNSSVLVRWNSHKRYLMDLAWRGVKTVPTRVIARNDVGAAKREIERNGWTSIVVKPAVSASGYETYLLRAPFDADAYDTIASVATLGDALIQPFIEEVSRDGELSFIYVDGVYSHAVLKRAAAGEFRVQTDHGGSVRGFAPTRRLIDQASHVMAAIPEVPLYARVDGVVRDGAFLLMELELIEPNLFLGLRQGAADRMADAVLSRLSR